MGYNGNDRNNGWVLEKTFEVGNAVVEVNSFDSQRPRYSIRVGWQSTDRQRVGAWFPYDPDADEPRAYSDDVVKAFEEAEAYILAETERRLKNIADEVQTQRERAAAKRKQHEANVERRREENRQRTAKSKTNGK
jgi:hypothetical protein